MTYQNTVMREVGNYFWVNSILKQDACYIYLSEEIPLFTVYDGMKLDNRELKAA